MTLRWGVLATVLAACGEPATRPVPISNTASSGLAPHPEDKSGIQGGVVDSKNGEAIVGAVVVAVAPAANHTETAITDDKGAYKMTLAPGDWIVTFYFGDVAIERRVHVGANVMTPVFMRIHSN